MRRKEEEKYNNESRAALRELDGLRHRRDWLLQPRILTVW